MIITEQLKADIKKLKAEVQGYKSCQDGSDGMAFDYGTRRIAAEHDLPVQAVIELYKFID